MPLIILPAVCKERGSPFGDPDVCSEHGMGYASLSMAIGAIYLWSYVYNIIRIPTSRNSKEVEVNDLPITNLVESSPVPNERSSTEVTEPLHSSIQLALPQTRFEENPQVSFSDKIKQHLEMLLKKMNLKRLFAPSTIAAIAGFVVGLVPQIRKLLIGDSAPVHVIQDTALLLGGGAIPAVTLIMGGNLLRGLKISGIQKSVILGIIIIRYVALPLLGIGVVKGAIHFGLVHHNPLYEFILLLQFALPPAMNIDIASSQVSNPQTKEDTDSLKSNAQQCNTHYARRFSLVNGEKRTAITIALDSIKKTRILSLHLLHMQTPTSEGPLLAAAHVILAINLCEINVNPRS